MGDDSSDTHPATQSHIPTLSPLYMIDVVLASSDDCHDPLDLASLCFSTIPAETEGNRCELVQVSPRRWEMEGSFEISSNMETIRCSAHSNADSEIGFVDLSTAPLRLLHRDSVSEIELHSGPTIHLKMSWQIASLETLVTRLTDRSVDLFNLYQRDGALSDIRKAISYQQQAICFAPEGHGKLPGMHNNLGTMLRVSFKRTGDVDDITKAISSQQKAVGLTQEGHSDFSARLKSLSLSWSARFGRTKELSDLTQAIVCQQRAVTLTAASHANAPSLLSELANLFLSRFERMGSFSDLDEAITSMERAVTLTVKGHPDLRVRLNNVGRMLSTRFGKTGDISDLEQAIFALRRAMELTPEDHTDLTTMLSNLGTILRICASKTGDHTFIDESISLLQRAVDLTTATNPELPSRLAKLGDSFKNRYVLTHDPTDIDEAILSQRRAVSMTPEGSSHFRPMISILIKLLVLRCDDVGDVSDLSEAIDLQRKSTRVTSETDKILSSVLSKLASLLLRRFRHVDDLKDLEEATSTQQQAVLLCPGDSPDLPNLYEKLGELAVTRFHWTEDLADIADAISYHQKSLALTPDGHEDLPSRLDNLGNSFQKRFLRTESLPDITEAISLQRRSIEVSSNSPSSLPSRLHNLGNSLMSRFDKTKALWDIDEAVASQRRAVALSPQGYTDLPLLLNSLGTALLCRFHATDSLPDIDEAVVSLQQAVKSTRGNADRMSGYNNLGHAYLSRFEHTDDVSDIAGAISSFQTAVDRTPEGHADMTRWLNNLGRSFLSRYTRSRKIEDLDECIASHKSALACRVATPLQRLKAALGWARALNEHRPQSPDIIFAFDMALDLVSMVAGLEHTVEGRYAHVQRRVAGLALESAAAACRLDRADKALEWLEEGRCLIWRQLNELRSSMDNLRLSDPELANSIAETSKLLEAAGASQVSSATGMTMSEKIQAENAGRIHLDLARRWDDLLVTARGLPGFEHFLKPSSCSSLLESLPDSGYVVVINVHETRCDAIAMWRGITKPLQIPLPKFSLTLASQYRAELGSQLHSENLRVRDAGSTVMQDCLVERSVRPVGRKDLRPRKDRPGVTRVLEGLWSNVVKPVIDALGIPRADQTDIEALPRIWWCPTGPLSFLPIHAAGTYGKISSVSIHDYAVSSYTPNVSALTRRARAPPIDKRTSGLFMTSQPNVPNVASIPGAAKEVALIHAAAERHGARVLTLEGDELTVQGCLEQMENFSCVHLACHATQNASEPLQSQFLFHSGPLDLGTIVRANIKHGDLAFLSACQTSTGQEKLSDEAVHLAAGMLAAGYRRVVATMWSIGDQPAQDLAVDFYEYLWAQKRESKEALFDGSLSAYALHNAVCRVRSRLDDSDLSLLTWIPFVHFGY